MPELLTVGAVTYAADNRVTVARRYPGNWKLLVREVKPDDEGVYECQISTHPPRVSKTYLHVNSKLLDLKRQIPSVFKIILAFQ